MNLVEWDDGHRPGSTQMGTKMALYQQKSLKSFVSIFDEFIPVVWCEFAYEYGVKKTSPWGILKV